MRALLDNHGTPVNGTDEWGRTALHIAAAAGSAEVVKVLMSHSSCEVSIKDKFGCTAADWARRRGHDGIAALLETQSEGIFAKY